MTVDRLIIQVSRLWLTLTHCGMDIMSNKLCYPASDMALPLTEWVRRHRMQQPCSCVRFSSLLTSSVVNRTMTLILGRRLRMSG